MSRIRHPSGTGQGGSVAAPESNWRLNAPPLQALTVHGFRSIRAQRVGFENPTFLVGRNGSGKSNAVDALAFLSDAMNSGLSSALSRRGGANDLLHRRATADSHPVLGLAVEMGPLSDDVRSARYAFALRTGADGEVEVEREQGLVARPESSGWFDRAGVEFEGSDGFRAPRLNAKALLLPVMSTYAEFEPVFDLLADIRSHHIEPEALRRPTRATVAARLRPDGGNAASVLLDVPNDDLIMLGEFMADIVPRIENVRAAPVLDRLALEFTQSWGESESRRFPASLMSDGALRVLGLLVAVFQRRPPSVLVVEEPETTVHATALGAITDLLALACEKTQVVVTTHSPELLDAEWMSPRNIRLVNWTGGVTRIAPVFDGARSVIEDRVMGAGDLLRSNVLTADERFAPEPEPHSLFVDSRFR